ncbi:MAG TPA: MXAN_5187 C-terminal domain-containing protein [Candidatus Saccharimonadales bacterium]|nr:MXAN_5187 C-terminal domain-containing protein [Candidatus Saccharimonadales bacterium]
MTIDEELGLLEDSFRRLKIEFDIYFAGGAKKPPVDTESRVQNLIRRNLDNGRLTFPQRFRLNSVAQKYSVFSDLWRRKTRIKDEGYRRPEDTLLGVGGFGHVDAPGRPGDVEPESFLLFTSDVIEVVALYEAVVRAREVVGQPLGAFDSFAKFVQAKSAQIRNQFHCEAVEYTVMVKGGQVRLKARARKDI